MPISNLSAPILEAMNRRGRGMNVGPVAQTNPLGVPATIPTPPVTAQGAGLPQASPMLSASATASNPAKDQTDARIIEALISYLRRKVL